jgi:hypothetical protein
MAFELFGFRIGRPEEASEEKPSIKSFAPPANDDGAIPVSEGGAFGTTVDLEGLTKNEAQLITKYREMALQPECQKAVDDIINEAVITDERELPVNVVLDEVEVPEKIKKRITEEFEYLLKLLNFNNKGYDVFKNWYVDGRLYYHIMIDEKKPREGIKELRYVDPRKIKKVRAERRQKNVSYADQQKNLIKKYNEYYIYSSKGLVAGNQGIKIAPDSIAYCHSGEMDQRSSTVISHMHKAIKPLNQLRMLEDATVIYRLARAPERRVFYIDVGSLPKAKAEQYLRDMMVKHKNKLVYDANTGDIRDDRKFLTMLEDYWLPRREGGKGTEITTLPGGQNLGEIDDVVYFRKKLYESLNVPVSRMESDSQFNIGRSSEITRDELKFAKFISRLRNRFGELFTILLERQLLLKGVITKEEWKEIKGNIYYDWLEDNHFAEMKNAEIMSSRLSLLNDIDQHVGKYFSTEWVRKNILMQTDEEIKEIDEQNAEEEKQNADAEEDQPQDTGGAPATAQKFTLTPAEDEQGQK